MKAKFDQWWHSKTEQEKADWECCYVSMASIVTVVPGMLITMF